MGFFDFLSGKREKKTLDELAQRLGGGEVKHKPNDHLWEWQGTVGEMRARVQIDGSKTQATIVPANDHGGFTLARNPALVKDAGDSPDEAWSEGDLVRLFVGPGVFLESMGFVVAEDVAAFENLPPGAGKRLVAAMADHRVGGLSFGAEEVMIGFAPDVEAERIAGFMRVVAEVLATTPSAGAVTARRAVAQGEGPDLASTRVKCGYCHCLFVLGADGKCPNCGGPAGG